MATSSLRIPLWLRLIGIISPMLLGIGLYALMTDASVVHPLLGNQTLVYLLVAAGGVLMALDLRLRIKLLRARRQSDTPES